MLSKNKEYVVDIVDIGQGGVGIGKYEGFTVFVEGGLIQDKVKVISPPELYERVLSTICKMKMLYER